jgi:LAO/AO transport system kinase
VARRTDDLDELVRRVRTGDARAVGRLLSLVENDSWQLRDIAVALAPFSGAAHVVGLTGPPGVGKSTLTGALITVLRERGQRIGVLAVDPTSPVSGGALLGDRIRMEQHTTDTNVFVRSLATRGQLGGLAAAVPQAVRVLDAAGCDVVVVETVGVGQAELQIAALADTAVLVLAPGLGDGVQAAKAGIAEIVDVLVVNKDDRDGAAQVARDLRAAQSLTRVDERRWRAPIVRTTATTGAGVTAVADAIAQHHDWLASGEGLAQRRLARAAGEIEAIALVQLRARLAAGTTPDLLDAAARRVQTGETDPYSAAADLLDTAFGG